MGFVLQRGNEKRIIETPRLWAHVRFSAGISHNLCFPILLTLPFLLSTGSVIEPESFSVWTLELSGVYSSV